MDTETTGTTKDTRTKAEIETQYQGLAMQLGDKVYRHSILGQEVNQIQTKMYELNQEASKISATVEAPPVDQL